MIEVKGICNTAVVYAAALEPGAEGFLRALCDSPLSRESVIRVMPDVHPGHGCVIGITMSMTDRVAPGLVGADIGCGMTVRKVSAKRLELQKLDSLIRERVPAGRAIRTVPHRFAEDFELETLRCRKCFDEDKSRRAVDTLGGGNHFIELDRGEDGSYWLIVHSGSRYLGKEVAKYYQDAAFRQCLNGGPYELAYTQGELMEDYFHDLRIVQDLAELNRRAIVDEIVKGMKLNVEDAFSTVHNYIDQETGILRKGAVSAKVGERLIIPLNMRDGCLLCVGKGNPAWNCSAPHGAGRQMSRADARQSFTLSQYKKEMAGIYTTSVSRETLDESPMAYKPMEDILAQLGDTVTVTARLRPVYNFKAGG